MKYNIHTWFCFRAVLYVVPRMYLNAVFPNLLNNLNVLFSYLFESAWFGLYCEAIVSTARNVMDFENSIEKWYEPNMYYIPLATTYFHSTIKCAACSHRDLCSQSWRRYLFILWMVPTHSGLCWWRYLPSPNWFGGCPNLRKYGWPVWELLRYNCTYVDKQLDQVRE